MNKTQLSWFVLVYSAMFAIVTHFFLFKSGGLGINVITVDALILFGALFITIARKRPIANDIKIASVLSLLFATSFFIWTSEISLALTSVGLAMANVYLLARLLGSEVKISRLMDLLNLVQDFIEGLFHGIDIFGHLSIRKSDTTRKVIRGLLFALPFMIVFIALFISSDLALQELLSEFNWGTNDILINICGTLFAFAVGILIFGSVTISDGSHAELAVQPIRNTAESLIVLTLLNALFLAFLIFQAQYLFGGQAAFDVIEHLTYAQYAKHGFVELAVIGGLVIFTIFFLRSFTRNSTRQFLRPLQLTLIAQTVILLLSAWSRLTLYVDQYGFTEARLFGYGFLILLVAVLGLLAAHVMMRLPQWRFTRQALFVTGVAMILFVAINPESLAIRLNMGLGFGAKAEDWPPEVSAQSYSLVTSNLENHISIQKIEQDLNLDTICATSEFVVLIQPAGKYLNRYDSESEQESRAWGKLINQYRNDFVLMQANRQWNTGGAWNLSRATIPNVAESDLIDIPTERDVRVYCQDHGYIDKDVNI